MQVLCCAVPVFDAGCCVVHGRGKRVHHISTNHVRFYSAALQRSPAAQMETHLGLPLVQEKSVNIRVNVYNGSCLQRIKRYKESACWKPLLFVSDFEAKKFVRFIGVLVVTELLVSRTQCVCGAIINAVEPVIYNHLFNETIWFRTLLFLWTQRGKMRLVNNRSFCDEWRSAIFIPKKLSRSVCLLINHPAPLSLV